MGLNWSKTDPIQVQGISMHPSLIGLVRMLRVTASISLLTTCPAAMVHKEEPPSPLVWVTKQSLGAWGAGREWTLDQQEEIQRQHVALPKAAPTGVRCKCLSLPVLENPLQTSFSSHNPELAPVLQSSVRFRACIRAVLCCAVQEGRAGYHCSPCRLDNLTPGPQPSQ